MTLKELKQKAKEEKLLVSPVTVSTSKLSIKRALNDDTLFNMLRKLNTSKYNRFELTKLEPDECYHIVLDGNQASVILDALEVYHEALSDYFMDEIEDAIKETVKGFGKNED